MVSQTVSDLLTWCHESESVTAPVPPAVVPAMSEALPEYAGKTPTAEDARAAFMEVETYGGRLALKDGQPFLCGDVVSLPKDLLPRLTWCRTEIIDLLQEWERSGADVSVCDPEPVPQPGRRPEPEAEAPAYGVRRDPETGKLHRFGDPSPGWLRSRGWTWDARQRRFVAPFPWDRDDPPPEFMYGGGPKWNGQGVEPM